MNSGIYKIANKVTGDFYIGSAVDLKSRLRSHKSKLKNQNHFNYILQEEYNKYGIDNLMFETIEFVEDKNNLIAKEQYYLDSLKPEYNICKIAGSNLGLKLSEKTRKKMSEARIGKKSPMLGKCHTEESKNKMSKAKKGNKFRLGKKLSEKDRIKLSLAHIGFKHSETTKKKLSKINKGKILSEEHKKKISKSRKGVKSSEETKKKISKSLIGNKRSLGYKHSKKARENMSIAQKNRYKNNE